MSLLSAVVFLALVLQHDDVSLRKPHRCRSARSFQEFPDAAQNIGVMRRQLLVLEGVFEHQFETRRGRRLVERDERAAIRQRHEHHAHESLEGAGGVDDDDGAAAELGQLSGGVRPLADFGLGDPHHRPTEIAVDAVERFDDGVGKGQRNGARRHRKLPRPPPAGRWNGGANWQLNFYGLFTFRPYFQIKNVRLSTSMRLWAKPPRKTPAGSFTIVAKARNIKG